RVRQQVAQPRAGEVDAGHAPRRGLENAGCKRVADEAVDAENENLQVTASLRAARGHRPRAEALHNLRNLAILDDGPREWQAMRTRRSGRKARSVRHVGGSRPYALARNEPHRTTY